MSFKSVCPSVFLLVWLLVYEGIIVAKVFSTCNCRKSRKYLFCMCTLKSQMCNSTFEVVNIFSTIVNTKQGLQVHKSVLQVHKSYPVHHNFKESCNLHFCYNHCSAVGAKHIRTPVFHNLRTCPKCVHS